MSSHHAILYNPWKSHVKKVFCHSEIPGKAITKSSLVLNIFLRNCNVNALSPWSTEVKDVIKTYLLCCQKMHPITSVARKFKNLSEKSWWIIPSKYIFLQHLVWWYIYQEMTLSPLLPIRVGPSLMHTQEKLKHLVTIQTWCSFYSICYYLEDRHDSQ